MLGLALIFLFAHLPACSPSSPGEAAPPGSESEPVSRDRTLTHADRDATLSELNSGIRRQKDVDTSGRIRFRYATEESGIDFVHRSGNSPEKYFPTANGSGVALLDYDANGDLDVYLGSTRGLPLDEPSDFGGSRLYRNDGTGHFEDVTDASGAGFRGFCHGVIAGDFDGDGTPDLYLANLGPNVLMLNNGDGTFRDASEGSGADLPDWSSGAAPLDYDGDGDLDLYVTDYGIWNEAEAERFCGDHRLGIRTYCSPVSMTPARDYLLRNKGDGTFEDVTEAAGIFRDDGRGLGVIAADLDRDGLVDLYVANDMCPNFLFLNNGDGTFEDAGDLSGATLTESGYAQAGMGIDAEDVDGDGLPDLLVTNFRNDYNTIYSNLGRRMFQDVSAQAGVVRESMAGVGWGCSLADFDNDSWPDMIVFNGHVDDNLDQIGQDAPYAQYAELWRNDGTGRFRPVEDAGPFFETPHVGRGAAFGDIDNDGDIDIIASRMDSAPAVLINESITGNWTRIELEGQSGRPVIGTAIEAHVGDRVIHRLVKGGGSYISSNDPRVLIGLGDAEGIDRLVVRWVGGGTTELAGLEANRSYRATEEADAGGTAD